MTNRDKKRARFHAYLMAYQHDISSLSPEEIVQSYWSTAEEENEQVKKLAEELFLGSVSFRERSDEAISKYLKRGWTISRLLPVDRSILRVATYEILNKDISPPEAVINDAVDFAKEYGEDEKSPAFINALLDKVKNYERKR